MINTTTKNFITFRGIEIPYNTHESFYKSVEAGEWEPYTFDAIDRFAPESSMFFDVGAWLGIFSYYYAMKFEKPVNAFECDPTSFDQLKDNAHSGLWGKAKSIGVHNYGLGSFCGWARLNTESSFGNSESSLQSRVNSLQFEKVIVSTFDFLIETINYKKRNFLLKVDIEGSEFDFLKGGCLSLLNRAPAKAIIIAFHPAWTPDLQSGIDFVVDNYFPVYDVESSHQPNVNITPEHFRDLLTNTGNHSFVFVRKDV